jgi:hypothetical protein
MKIKRSICWPDELAGYQTSDSPAYREESVELMATATELLRQAEALRVTANELRARAYASGRAESSHIQKRGHIANREARVRRMRVLINAGRDGAANMVALLPT